MDAILRNQRIACELNGLRQLAALNPDILQVSDSASFFEHRALIVLKQTPAPFHAEGRIDWRDVHQITLLFGRLYPAVPFEPYIVDPPFHPNISVDDGFVCLWEDFDPRRSAVDGIVALRNILTWQTFNPLDAHLMQPEALRFSGGIVSPARPDWPRLKLPGTTYRRS